MGSGVGTLTSRSIPTATSPPPHPAVPPVLLQPDSSLLLQSALRDEAQANRLYLLRECSACATISCTSFTNDIPHVLPDKDEVMGHCYFQPTEDGAAVKNNRVAWHTKHGYADSNPEWRRGPDSNRGLRICNPLHGHFATAPRMRLTGGSSSSRTKYSEEAGLRPAAVASAAHDPGRSCMAFRRGVEPLASSWTGRHSGH